MSDIHVSVGNNDGEIQLVMHFPVPDVNNDVGVNFRLALINSGIGLNEETGRRTILNVGTSAGEINPAEEALIDAGELFEGVVFTRVPDSASGAELIALVQSEYTRSNSRVQQEIGARLRYFGHTLSAA